MASIEEEKKVHHIVEAKTLIRDNLAMMGFPC